FSVAGVWVDRTGYALPQAPYPIVPHGYIDESNKDNVPRFHFVDANWTTNRQAKAAEPIITAAFATYSALQAGTSPVTGKKLITGLEFSPVAANAPAEIEIHWGGAGAALGSNIRVFDP